MRTEGDHSNPGVTSIGHPPHKCLRPNSTSLLSQETANPEAPRQGLLLKTAKPPSHHMVFVPLYPYDGEELHIFMLIIKMYPKFGKRKYNDHLVC